MEVEEQGEVSYVTSGGSGTSVSVSLHPLVIMNISDHFTRVRVQQQDDFRLPLGARLLELTQPYFTASFCPQCMACYWAHRRVAVLIFVTHLNFLLAVTNSLTRSISPPRKSNVG